MLIFWVIKAVLVEFLLFYGTYYTFIPVLHDDTLYAQFLNFMFEQLIINRAHLLLP